MISPNTFIEKKRHIQYFSSEYFFLWEINSGQGPDYFYVEIVQGQISNPIFCYGVRLFEK